MLKNSLFLFFCVFLIFYYSLISAITFYFQSIITSYFLLDVLYMLTKVVLGFVSLLLSVSRDMMSSEAMIASPRRRRLSPTPLPARKVQPPVQDIEAKNIFYSLATKWEDIDLTNGVPVKEYLVRGTVSHVDERRIRVMFDKPIRFVKDIPLDRVPCTKYIYNPATASLLLVEFDPNASFRTMEQLYKWKEYPLKPMFVSNVTLSKGITLVFKVLQFFNGDNKLAISINSIE